ncbi:MAG TPA: ribbon-helix-helix protein, CopG family [Actinomycetales bacterium]|nr:ribbon-helix-helix protein, CopG family [Actinomycetales bacterium]
MRTTLNLDDDLARAVKAKAAAEGRTLTSVVEDALRRALDEKPAEYEHVPLPTFAGDGPAPGVDLSDPQALRDLMYEDEDAFYRSVFGGKD